jgi:hypothetical protein
MGDGVGSKSHVNFFYCLLCDDAPTIPRPSRGTLIRKSRHDIDIESVPEPKGF